MNDYPHDPEQEAIDIRRGIVRQQQASYESFIKTEERNRIIKLLAENSKCTLDGGHNQLGYCFCEAVELIKGESNE
jgi:hypothetical protein